MSRFRSHWLALFGGVTLIALSMSSAFAGKPDGNHPGLHVSAYVHSLVGDDEETGADTDAADEAETETPDDTETTDETEVDVEDASSDHGACVSAVAQDKEAVGGDNENHGGAVSEAARVTCQGEAAADEPKADEPTEDADKGNGHGDSHGDDSSDD
ncbi:MAG: hypothetical protein H0W81_12595 [Chloroflexi bacterium]|nr:hypothetical protein [Chloroflexota bacterium]